jgi:hypothetical protein
MTKELILCDALDCEYKRVASSFCDLSDGELTDCCPKNIPKDKELTTIKEDFVEFCKQKIKRVKGIVLHNLVYPENDECGLFFEMSLQEFIKEHVRENEYAFFYDEDYENAFYDFDSVLEYAGSDFDCSVNCDTSNLLITEKDIFGD